MRIGLCGAGGTGKGTLAKAFHEKHPEIKVIPSTIQHVGKIISPDSENYKEIQSAFRPMFQNMILAVQAETERTIAANDLEYISERSLLDFVPYMDRVLEDLFGHIDKDAHNVYLNRVKLYPKETPYTHIFYLPEEDFDPADGEDASWKERNQSDRLETSKSLKNLLQDIGLSMDIPVTVLSGTVEERLEKMEKHLFGDPK